MILLHDITVLWYDTHTAGALWWPSVLPLLFDVSVKACCYQAWWDGLWLEWFQVCEAAFSVCIWSLQANGSYPYVPDRLRWARMELDLTGHSINLHHRPLCPHLWSPFPLYISFSISPFPLDSLSLMPIFHMEASQVSHPLRTKRSLTSCHDRWPKPPTSPAMTSLLPVFIVPNLHVHPHQYRTGCTCTMWFTYKTSFVGPGTSYQTNITLTTTLILISSILLDLITNL